MRRDKNNHNYSENNQKIMETIIKEKTRNQDLSFQLDTIRDDELLQLLEELSMDPMEKRYREG